MYTQNVHAQAGVFYFSLDNLHPKHRSQYSAIHLVALCKRKYISMYSMNTVLGPVIEDIKQLVSFMFTYGVLWISDNTCVHRREATPSRSVMLNKQSLELFV